MQVNQLETAVGHCNGKHSVWRYGEALVAKVVARFESSRQHSAQDCHQNQQQYQLGK